MNVDSESRHVNHVNRKLVIPAERNLFERRPQRGPSRRDLDLASRRDHPLGDKRPTSWSAFSVEWQPVPHVGQRLLVQLFVLDERVHRLTAV